MADPWPNTLPNTFEVSGYSEELPDNQVYSMPDAGRAMARKRFSAAPVKISGTMIVDAADKVTLTNFYKAQTGLRFSWDNDISTGTKYYMFAGPLKYTPLSGLDFRAALDLWEFATEFGGS